MAARGVAEIEGSQEIAAALVCRTARRWVSVVAAEASLLAEFTAPGLVWRQGLGRCQGRWGHLRRAA
ncbi:hypothetical protein [Mycobacterium montefiorense]|uniref:hypothetical protein n=1 Tax=Mycobacterium montefiorense TaxID=154654 RepID=UPI0021F3BD82|nr:hypothetical protein [Mycobacterium montefiorense]MCV7427245.1 hypothetical protein [Mycobacterium montefiorense]